MRLLWFRGGKQGHIEREARGRVRVRHAKTTTSRSLQNQWGPTTIPSLNYCCRRLQTARTTQRRNYRAWYRLTGCGHYIRLLEKEQMRWRPTTLYLTTKSSRTTGEQLQSDANLRMETGTYTGLPTLPPVREATTGHGLHGQPRGRSHEYYYSSGEWVHSTSTHKWYYNATYCTPTRGQGVTTWSWRITQMHYMAWTPSLHLQSQSQDVPTTTLFRCRLRTSLSIMCWILLRSMETYMLRSRHYGIFSAAVLLRSVLLRSSRRWGLTTCTCLMRRLRVRLQHPLLHTRRRVCAHVWLRHGDHNQACEEGVTTTPWGALQWRVRLLPTGSLHWKGAHWQDYSLRLESTTQHRSAHYERIDSMPTTSGWLAGYYNFQRVEGLSQNYSHEG